MAISCCLACSSSAISASPFFCSRCESSSILKHNVSDAISTRRVFLETVHYIKLKHPYLDTLEFRREHLLKIKSKMPFPLSKMPFQLRASLRCQEVHSHKCDLCYSFLERTPLTIM